MSRLIVYMVLLLSCMCVHAQEYANDWERMALPDGTRRAVVKGSHEELDRDTRLWWCEYIFTREGKLMRFQSHVDDEDIYLWDAEVDHPKDCEGLLIEGGVENKDHLSVELYPEYEGVGMIYRKGDMVVVHPRRKGVWELHYIDYCTDYAVDSDVDCTELGYQTAPFVLIRTKDLCFTTRNYGGQSIPIYVGPDETSRVVGEINKAEISLHPYDYDSTNEMVLIRYKGKWGWISTEWVCANPFTTCC